MSGGHFNYFCFEMDRLADEWQDRELDELWKDLSELAHTLEWYRSGDTDEKPYFDAVVAFKQKWFQGDRAERFKGYLEEEYKKLRDEFVDGHAKFFPEDFEG